jgi:hypothetical protein
MIDNHSMIFRAEKDSSRCHLGCVGFWWGGSGVIVGLKCYILYGVTPAANDEWNVGMAKIEMIHVLVMNM